MFCHYKVLTTNYKICVFVCVCVGGVLGWPTSIRCTDLLDKSDNQKNVLSFTRQACVHLMTVQLFVGELFTQRYILTIIKIDWAEVDTQINKHVGVRHIKHFEHFRHVEVSHTYMFADSSTHHGPLNFNNR